LSKSQIISIVDDDESVRVAIARLARSLGFVSYSFASGEEFLRSPHLNGTACLIADMQMPGMNGLELQDALLAGGHRIPIIFITAHPERHIRERAEARGAIAFFEKPCNVLEVAKSLEVALRQ
jgi:FixJ family two-component response regulator